MKYTDSYSNYDVLFGSFNQTATTAYPESELISEHASTSNIHNLIQFTIPDGKLFYPEPFIASPSYLHSDISFLHIFQY